MATLHGKTVVVRKAQKGDKVISRLTGREYVVTDVVKAGNKIVSYVGSSTAWRGLPKGFRAQDVAVLAKKA